SAAACPHWAGPRTPMTVTSDRIPLPQVRDLLRIGHPLPFRVLDSQGRLLLNEGHMLADEAQFEALVERGAWAERALVEAVRAARRSPLCAVRADPHAALCGGGDADRPPSRLARRQRNRAGLRRADDEPGLARTAGHDVRAGHAAHGAAARADPRAPGGHGS